LLLYSGVYWSDSTEVSVGFMPDELIGHGGKGPDPYRVNPFLGPQKALGKAFIIGGYGDSGQGIKMPQRYPIGKKKGQGFLPAHPLNGDPTTSDQ